MAIIYVAQVSLYLAVVKAQILHMQVILYLIVLSLTVAVGFLFAFFWAVRDGQYEDDYTPSMRILVDDDMLPASHVSETSDSNLTDHKHIDDV